MIRVFLCSLYRMSRTTVAEGTGGGRRPLCSDFSLFSFSFFHDVFCYLFVLPFSTDVAVVGHTTCLGNVFCFLRWIIQIWFLSKCWQLPLVRTSTARPAGVSLEIRATVPQQFRGSFLWQDISHLHLMPAACTVCDDQCLHILVSVPTCLSGVGFGTRTARRISSHYVGE